MKNNFAAVTDLWCSLCRPDVYSHLLRHGWLADAGNVHVLQGEEQNESRWVFLSLHCVSLGHWSLIESGHRHSHLSSDCWSPEPDWMGTNQFCFILWWCHRASCFAVAWPFNQWPLCLFQTGGYCTWWAWLASWASPRASRHCRAPAANRNSYPRTSKVGPCSGPLTTAGSGWVWFTISSESRIKSCLPYLMCFLFFPSLQIFTSREIIGFSIGSVSSMLYLCSRLPQIYTNVRRILLYLICRKYKKLTVVSCTMINASQFSMG